MQQFLESTPSDKIRIAIDHREDQLFDNLFKGWGAEVDRRVLDVGDFLCSSRLVVERKTRSDFESSIIDGRLFTQLPNLIKNYERVIIIVEGSNDDGRINRNALMGAYASIMADFGASLIFTRDKDGTADLVFNLAKHEQIAKKTPMRIYAKKHTLTPSQSARSIIEMLPSIGPKLSKALLKHFGTVEDLMKASEKDLAFVVGKKRAKMIRDILSYEYVESEDQSMY
ncbi:3'-flap repair endonuclease Xpf [Candidatus Bilamarchaeum dharawalense]|uniref:3'-flap repair endonuclease Xpf n=1 Tax=Candidatus Bilamarchaeum dharawalense TaxID=2885759 RepID=A0A5E4LMW1_9ARCH|nr:3'-flap repair endonuclease Xpf [Candidatus Bilamarchaeum dharawalense]